MSSRLSLGSSPINGQDPLVDEVLEKFSTLLAVLGVSPDYALVRIMQSLSGAALSGPSQNSIDLGQVRRDCMEVLCVWRRDPVFQDETGLPRPLTATGTDVSFEYLCHVAGAKTNHQTILEVLQKFGAVTVDDQGAVTPNTPTFLVVSTDGDSLLARDGVLKQLVGFLGVLEHNVCSTATRTRPRFERSCSVRVAEELVPIFELFVAERGQQFVDSIDEWLERKRSVTCESGRLVEVGAGAYFLELSN